MKKFVIAMMALMLVTGAVYASDKPALGKEVMSVDLMADLNEVEPNNDCTVADVIAAGDVYSAVFSDVDDEDWFEVFSPAGGTYTFETHAGDVDPSGDTKMYIFAADCTTQLAYMDDGGVGYYSKISDFVLGAGEVVYVRIIPFNSNAVGSYLLTMTEADPPCDVPANDTCAGALPLPVCGETFTVDNCGATNAYSPGVYGDSCTGYGANGRDLVYVMELVADQQVTITASTSYDNAIYLITDCGDSVGSCVAGADSDVSGHIETLVFDTADAPGTYYLILDGFSSTAEGVWEVIVDCVVSTEATTFDGIKSMYR